MEARNILDALKKYIIDKFLIGIVIIIGIIWIPCIFVDASQLSTEREDGIVDSVSEEQDDLEKQEVIDLYMKLKTFYEENVEYFGIPLAYYTTMNTPEEPYRALLSVMDMDSKKVNMDELKKTIVGITNSLESYIELYGDELLKFRDTALASLDDNMSDVEKYLVLHDYVIKHCSFNLDHRIDGSDSLLESTALGAVSKNSVVCLGYVSLYSYLVQNAFPQIYKNDDGTWKNSDQIVESAVIDCGRIYGESEVHYYNVVQLEGTWYYVDVCYDDVVVPHFKGVRIETNGNCYHKFFMISYEKFKELADLKDRSLVDNYRQKCKDNSFEKSWFYLVDSTIYYNDEYWFYVKKQNSSGNLGKKFVYIEKKDQIVSRHRKSDEENTVVDLASGTICSINGEISYIDYGLKSQYVVDIFMDRIYPGLQHTIALYEDKIYFNIANKLYEYDCSNCAITKVKEYNIINAQKNNENDEQGVYCLTSKKYENIIFKVLNRPIAGIDLKNDGILYIDIATNFSASTVPAYSVEEKNYIYNYDKFGECISSDKSFRLCANVRDKLDMHDLNSESHTYEWVTVESSCLEDGFEELRCKECGKSTNQNKRLKEKMGHHYMYDLAEKIYICTECNGVSEQAYEHNYSKYVFNWSDDHLSCELLLYCSICKEKGQEEKKVKCNVGTDITDASFETEGKIIYKASCEFQGKEFYQTYEKNIPKLEVETTLAQDVYTLYVSESEKIAYKSNYSKESIIETVSLDPDIVSVSKNGIMKALSEGTTEIIVRTKGGYTFRVSVKVVQPQVSLTYKKIALQLNKSTNAVKIKTKTGTDEVAGWKVSNRKILSVNKKGVIKAKRIGRATVTVLMKSGASAKCTVVVQAGKIRTKKISVNAKKINLSLGKNNVFKLKVVKTPITASDKIIYKVKNKKIAMVNATGRIRARKVGTTYVTITAGKKTKKVGITVKR